MAEALHLQHVAWVWRPDGPLQASLARALGTEPTPSKPTPKLQTVAKRRARIEARIERWIDRLNRLDGDPDSEADPDEIDSDFEPSIS